MTHEFDNLIIPLHIFIIMWRKKKQDPMEMAIELKMTSHQLELQAKRCEAEAKKAETKMKNVIYLYRM